MAYIHPPNGNTPGTHCLVIGVGKYEPNEWGLADLTSPVPSAEAMANWLKTDYNSPDAKLASIDLVCSPAPGQANPLQNPDPATFDGVKQAVNRWFKLCDASPDNVGIFYFCGHGFQKGSSQVLLLEGFAAPGELSVVGDAIDFENFTLGMARCKARRQIYFVDACRATPKSALQITSSLGVALVDPNFALIPTSIPRNYPIFYSTNENHVAFGANGTVSLFTSALIRCLNGAGWDDRDDPWTSWCVNSDTLATFVRDLLSFESAVRGFPIQAPVLAGQSTGFVLHRPTNGQGPIVPLLIGCKTPSSNASTTFAVLDPKGASACSRNPAEVDDWQVALPAGKYSVKAINGAQTVASTVVLRPACKIVRLEI